MAKRKPDPFFACPDGSRAQSAWLGKLQAAAKSFAEQGGSPFGKLLATNTLEANSALVRERLVYLRQDDSRLAVAWECLIQWYGPAAVDHLANQLEDKHVLKVIDSFHTEAAQALLLDRLDLPDVREVVANRAERWPLYTLRGLLARNPSRDQPAASLLQRLLHVHPEWSDALSAALQAEGDGTQAKTLARLLAPAEQVIEAGVDELPALLREPPWRRAAPVDLPVLVLMPRREPAVVDWSLWQGGTIVAWPQNRAKLEWAFNHYFDDLKRSGSATPDAIAVLHRLAQTEGSAAGQALFLWGVIPERISAVLAAGTVGPDDLIEPPANHGLLNHLGHLDDALALSLLRLQRTARGIRQSYEYPGDYNDTCGNPVVRLLKRFGAEHVETIFAVMPSSATQAQAIMDVVDWDGLALHLSQYGYTARRQLRAFAHRWLLAHPRTAARALIPAAFSDDAGAAAHARHHLYMLAGEGDGDTLRTEARAYGDQTLAAIEQLLSTPPEMLLPAQLPKLPAWLVPPRLPRLRLMESGHGVPLANLPDVLMTMALSKGGMIYAGLERLQPAMTADSLARLMLGLFEQWLENGMPPKDRWILELQGRFGDDANARALAPRIREWRSRLDRVRSYDGLELLAQIGSDTALMLLSTFREQKRYGDLHERAAKALEQVAEERGLTLEQLADRTVPTLDLDERGQLALDFGPRQFTASLTAELVPQVHDAEGARLKDLPKPGTKDDAERAKLAVADWKEFKKQAKLIAGTQTARLEAAMCLQRRWPAADFLAFFVRHPVLRNLCQRLVWAVFDHDGALTGTLRVSEDLSLADADDASFVPASCAIIGLPHPLELNDSLRARWTALLAEYEILQPFEQMLRQSYALAAEELPLDRLPRYQGRKLSTGSLLGLEQRGWKRSVGDGGMIDSLTKAFDDRYEATLGFGPGWFVAGPPATDEEQELRGVFLHGIASADEAPPAWRDLPSVLLSEMLRDLDRLAWHTRDR